MIPGRKFHDTSAGESANAEGVVESDRTCRYYFDLLYIVVAEFHHRSAAVRFFDLAESLRQGVESGLFYGFFGRNGGSCCF